MGRTWILGPSLLLEFVFMFDEVVPAEVAITEAMYKEKDVITSEWRLVLAWQQQNYLIHKIRKLDMFGFG